VELAAKYAADLGLEVWFSPYPLELSTDEMLSLVADCAERGERLRQQGADVVFVAGAELSLMNTGFLPGESIGERLLLLGGTVSGSGPGARSSGVPDASRARPRPSQDSSQRDPQSAERANPSAIRSSRVRKPCSLRLPVNSAKG